MKKIGVSQKIKILGALLLSSIFCVIVITIYLNQNNIKDATIVNIAGKQRMLTQRITKNIFYLYQTRANNFVEIDNAIDEFKYGLETLRDGNALLKISEAPTEKIANQISKVSVMWATFEKNTVEFKKAILNNDIEKLNSILEYIYQTNNKLLEEVDEIVTLYTEHIEEKTAFIKNFQYLSFSFLFIFSLYSLVQLRQIESHANEFLEKYKKISSSDITEIEPIEIETEKEFIEMADNINFFINKVNSAMNYSEVALEQSRLASEKLQDLTDEFEDIIGELENKSEIVKSIDRSEDIAIESSDNLIKTTKKLNDLKKQLDSILKVVENKS
ncbi:type IV pili methyl-accepting chemotaxis transducer N-terminal domain-containing protein [Halarcobacter sp.]|uniref:type IV pili methyl-accepting chemotaxis transducer N-terminal domain-containing protein n=1 Tax=Halarcobacter sp. TaxID=2321133 RepID=UPI002AAC0759|nr:type IV pili methyl-accepting chemotaxis transducer N-terminal domain-containing protein [Halarcobacter sp.]